MHGGTQGSTPQAHAPLRKGTVIGERFEVIRQIDQDALSGLYECHDHEDERIVWVRVASPSLCGDAAAAEAAAAKLAPVVGGRTRALNPLRYVDVHQGTTLFTVEPAVDGDSLATRLNSRGNGRLDVDELLPIVTQLARALDELPPDRYHGEVRLERVYLTRDNEVILTGAHLLECVPARALGTLLRAHDRLRREFAPEVLTGVARDSSDLFSAGQLVYQALTGERAVEPGAPLSPTLGAIGQALQALIAPHPRDRPPSLTPLLEALSKHDGSVIETKVGMQTLDLSDEDLEESEPTAVVRNPVVRGHGGMELGTGSEGAAGALLLSSGDFELELDESDKTRQLHMDELEPVEAPVIVGDDALAAASSVATATASETASSAKPANSGEFGSLEDLEYDDLDEEATRRVHVDEVRSSNDESGRSTDPSEDNEKTKIVARPSEEAPSTTNEPSQQLRAVKRERRKRRDRNMIIGSLIAAVVIVASSLMFALHQRAQLREEHDARVRQRLEQLRAETSESEEPAER